jgi:large subunit ribosomal protein L24
MKKRFSAKWVSSRQKRKQRKYRFNADLHIRKKMVSAHLSKELRKKYSRRSFQLRKGDIIKVTKGSFKGKTGKVNIVNLTKLKVNIEGLQRQKKDGTKINVFIDPSNLIITELNLVDKKRLKILERKNAQNKTINA